MCVSRHFICFKDEFFPSVLGIVAEDTTCTPLAIGNVLWRRTDELVSTMELSVESVAPRRNDKR